LLLNLGEFDSCADLSHRWSSTWKHGAANFCLFLQSLAQSDPAPLIATTNSWVVRVGHAARRAREAAEEGGGGRVRGVGGRRGEKSRLCVLGMGGRAAILM